MWPLYLPVAPYYVLGVASCVVGLTASQLTFEVGKGPDNLANYVIESFSVHTEFDITTHANDIAMFKTSTQIILGKYVGLACLPFRADFSTTETNLLVNDPNRAVQTLIKTGLYEATPTVATCESFPSSLVFCTTSCGAPSEQCHVSFFYV